MVDLYDEFAELIQNKEWISLKNLLNQHDPFHLAQMFEETSEEDLIILFRLLTRVQAKEVFQLLYLETQQQIIEKLAQNNQKLSNLLNDLEPDDRTAFFEELPGTVSHQLIQCLSPEERKITIRLMGYPEDSIGRLMTPEYVAVKPDFTVEQTFEHIRQFGKDSETLNVIYVVDNEFKLLDDLRIKQVLLASPQQKIEELIDRRFVALNAMDDQETAIKTFSDYDRVALPVIDAEGVLIGLVSVDDILDVAEEER